MLAVDIEDVEQVVLAGALVEPEVTKRVRRSVPMVIEFTEYERPRRLASTTTMTSMDIAYTLTFEPLREGTRMRWSGEIEPHGTLRLMGPLVAWMGRRQELRTWIGLKGLLEGRVASVH